MKLNNCVKESDTEQMDPSVLAIKQKERERERGSEYSDVRKLKPYRTS